MNNQVSKGSGEPTTRTTGNGVKTGVVNNTPTLGSINHKNKNV